MTLQAADREARIAESIPHLRPISETCIESAVLAEELARVEGREDFLWHEVQRAFGAWLDSRGTPHKAVMLAMLNAIRRFSGVSQ